MIEVNKCKMFKTAEVKGHVFTNNGENDLQAGEVVGVSFRCIAWNQLYRRDMPVYTVIQQNGQVWGDLYESALTRFVL